MTARFPHLHVWALERARPFYWREAGLCLPAIPLILAASIAAGQMAYGAVAAGAAGTLTLTVGAGLAAAVV